MIGAGVVALVFGPGSGLTAETERKAEPVKRYGLTVRDGVLMKEGRPYYGIGANYFDLFYRILLHPDDESSLEGLRRLSEAGVPFVRFAACGYWPADFDLYRRDPEAWFQRMDRVVKEAEATGIGLIPSLFWYYGAVPDLVGEPMDQWGNPRSGTIAFMRRYTREVVTRYRGSPAIWGWEMGNEYALAADLPNAAEHRPHVDPKLGTPDRRTERDDLSAADVAVAMREFAREVRRHDPYRMITSGQAIPRPSAWHNTREKSWTQDSRGEFAEVIARDNPDPVNVISVHLYPQAKETYFGDGTDVAGVIPELMSISARLRKPLFIGEFGAPESMGREEARRAYRAILEAIERRRVPLSAFWVFDLAQQDGEWNATFDNDRAWVIREATAAHRRLQKRAGTDPEENPDAGTGRGS